MKKVKLKNILLTTALVAILSACNSNQSADNSSSQANANEQSTDNVSVSQQESLSNDSSEEIVDNQSSEEVTENPVSQESSSEDASLVESTQDQSSQAESDSENVEDFDLQEEDGYYVSTLFASKNGEVVEPDIETIKSAVTDGNILTVTGSIGYRESEESQEDSKQLENSEYNFKVDQNTVYQAVGGLSEGEKLTAEEFNKRIEEVKESGLALIIHVENGVVTEVSISS